MLGWTEHSVRKYAPTHVIMPTAMTVTEALLQTSWGAHFQKLMGTDIGFIKRCRGDAAFDYCPIIVTGGQTPATIPATIQAGAMMIGTGFDLTLKGQPADVGVPKITEVMKQYLQVSQQARAQTWPDLAKTDAGPKQAWLDALPHWHPF
jgi:2-keto-3-deoxy-6-phosphogluconate aldolase